MSFFNYYRLVLYNLTKWFAVMMFAVCVLLLILIVCDLLFDLDWGYPWWSTLIVLALIAISLAIFQGAKTALKLMKI